MLAKSALMESTAEPQAWWEFGGTGVVPTRLGVLEEGEGEKS